jgi:hypothetical protein
MAGIKLEVMKRAGYLVLLSTLLMLAGGCSLAPNGPAPESVSPDSTQPDKRALNSSVVTGSEGTVAEPPVGDRDRLANEEKPAANEEQTTVSAPVNAVSNGCANPVPEGSRFGLLAWPNTNFCLHSVSYEEIRSGGLTKDRIPAISEPVFQTVSEADLWLADVEPVISLQLDGEERAYPLQVMVWHEIVNDTVSGRPITITYCPLCNSALVFDRSVGGQLLDFGTTGNLRRADLIMYDRQTESWWQQFTGEAIVGEMTGTRLEFLPSVIVSFGDFKQQFPGGKILFPDVGLERLYGETPYINYDSLANPGTKWLDEEADHRLPPKMRVLALTVEETAIAYPYSLLSEAGVVNDVQAGRRLAIFWKAGTASALYKQVIAESKDVGSAAAFNSVLDGQTLTFEARADGFVDRETGSNWNIFGFASDGPMTGRQLDPIPANEFLWFAWAAFQPDTLIYESP